MKMLQMQLPFEDEWRAANDNNQPINDHEAYFWEFHAANPDVYDLVEKIVFQKMNEGHGAYGMKAIFEIIRWEHPIKVNAVAGEYRKLKNAMAPYYTRLFNRNNPLDADFLTIAPIRKVGG